MSSFLCKKTSMLMHEGFPESFQEWPFHIWIINALSVFVKYFLTNVVLKRLASIINLSEFHHSGRVPMNLHKKDQINCHLVVGMAPGMSYYYVESRISPRIVNLNILDVIFKFNFSWNLYLLYSRSRVISQIDEVKYETYIITLLSQYTF